MADPNHVRRAVEARDVERMLRAFREDAALCSPVTFTPFAVAARRQFP